MEQKPKTQMFVQWFVCPKNFEWINIPTIIIWWSWSGVWSWCLTLLFMMKVLFLIKVTVWYFLSSTHEGMTNCTHLLSYLQPVKCCCGVCWGISIDMFWDVPSWKRGTLGHCFSIGLHANLISKCFRCKWYRLTSWNLEILLPIFMVCYADWQWYTRVSNCLQIDFFEWIAG